VRSRTHARSGSSIIFSFSSRFNTDRYKYLNAFHVFRVFCFLKKQKKLKTALVSIFYYILPDVDYNRSLQYTVYRKKEFLQYSKLFVNYSYPSNLAVVAFAVVFSVDDSVRDCRICSCTSAIRWQDHNLTDSSEHAVVCVKLWG
jgi:hypothetical protein